MATIPAFLAGSDVKLRERQQEILQYEGGRLGISAVPGSGKTFTLSLLAVKLIHQLAADNRLDQQEVLIVTFSNAAVYSFRTRINTFIAEQSYGGLPGTGYSVRTLHSLALEIVRARPAFALLSEDFAILDDNRTRDLRERTTRQVLETEAYRLEEFLNPEYTGSTTRFYQDARDWVGRLIETAKLKRLDPVAFRERWDGQAGDFPLLEIGLKVYEKYQDALGELNALDYTDLLYLAVSIVEQDPHMRARLEHQWPFVLEDEAQDSNPLQEDLLTLITAENHNWVRVGDPNQAINTTFTGADPRLLHRFLDDPRTVSLPLEQSGRSTTEIMACANGLIDWSRRHYAQHPDIQGLAWPWIEPSGPDDPQPNPVTEGPSVVLRDLLYQEQGANQDVARSIRRWQSTPEARTQTVAVLTYRNDRAQELANALQAQDIEVDETLLRSTSQATRQVERLKRGLDFLINPDLNLVKRIWQEDWVKLKCGDLHPVEEADTYGDDATPLDRMQQAMDTDWQQAGAYIENWMQSASPTAQNLAPPEKAVIEDFRATLARWTESVLLPVDEIVLQIGADLFASPEDMALAYRLSLYLHELVRGRSDKVLALCSRELGDLISGRSSGRGVLSAETEYRAVPGQVTVSTMHSAKGLEWDRVYLAGLNDFVVPADTEQVYVKGSGSYVRNSRGHYRDMSLDLGAEVEMQVSRMAAGTLGGYQEGLASYRSRCATIDERLRLLYVAITRARRYLVLLYDEGSNPQFPRERAEALGALAQLEVVDVRT